MKGGLIPRCGDGFDVLAGVAAQVIFTNFDHRPFWMLFAKPVYLRCLCVTESRNVDDVDQIGTTHNN